MGKILSVAEKQGQRGAFWVVQTQEGESLCFDGGIKDLEGKETEYERVEKNGKFFLNLPKKGGGYGGGGGKKQVNTDAMILSYAKDLAVCLLNLKQLPVEDIDKFILMRYSFFKKEVLKESIAPAQQVKPESAPKRAEGASHENKSLPPTVEKNPDFHRGAAVKCLLEDMKLRSSSECFACEHLGGARCHAWRPKE